MNVFLVLRKESKLGCPPEEQALPAP
jgi:hypothetical protein